MIFLTSPHSLQDMIHSIQQQVWVWIVWWYMIDWFDLPNLTTFTTGSESFYKTTSLSLESLIMKWLIDMIFLNSLHSGLDIGHSIQQQVWIWIVWWYMIDWFDLPNLTTFTPGVDSFYYSTTSLSLSSTLIEWLIDLTFHTFRCSG